MWGSKMNTSDIELIRLKYMLLFLQSPNSRFSLYTIDNNIKTDKTNARNTLKGLISLGIIEEVLEEKATFFKYIEPEIVTFSWRDNNE
jgi:predicted transcriptional regulator